MKNEKLVTWLFETNAIRVCEDNRPFWYTSGAIGPYYINTHFLYGSEQKANLLLKLIDETKEDKMSCPIKILNAVKENYETDNIYHSLMDELISFIKDNIDINEIDYISGGERRDWFFSLLAADMLKKPHITIYKDMDMVIYQDENVTKAESLQGCNVLHIADLLNEASSYAKMWVPAVSGKGGKIKWSIVIVDRKQGGEELLRENGIIPLSMIGIDKDTFEKAEKLGHINKQQHEMIKKYIENPRESMRNFLLSHPEFLEESLKADSKTAARAKLCIDNNIYGL